MITVETIEIVSNIASISCVGKPIDVAKVVYFLATDEASYISGENITVDGGIVLWITFLNVREK